MADQPALDFGKHVIPYCHKKGMPEYAYEFNGTDGYVVLDGYIDYDQGWFNHNGYMYCGLFFTGDVFVIVLAYTSSSSAHAEVDDFLKALGYPVPADFF